MKGINIFETKDYVSKFETDKENPTVWKLGCIDQMIMSELEDLATEYVIDPKAPENARAKTVFHFNRKKMDLVRFGLKGFDNFLHPQTGKPIEFSTTATPRFVGSMNVVCDRILGLIPGNVLDELANEIDSMNRLSKDEEKNL